MITELRIPYPDFKMGDMIDPEQHDMNNLYIQLKVNSIVELCNKITGEDPSGVTGAELMALKPIAPFTETKIQTFLQALINRLQASTGATGANLIGTTAKIKLTGTNVEAQLAFIDAWMQTAFVGTAQLQDASVTTPKLANLNVTEQKIADLAVTTPKLNNGAVTNTKLGEASVGTSKIIDLNVTTSKLADLAVTDPKLASNSVTTSKILNLAVTEPKLADLNVTRPKLANRAVDSTKLELLAVQNENIANQAVGNTKLAERSVTSTKIGTEQVKLEHLDPALLQTLPESQLTQKVLKLETDVGQLQMKDTTHDSQIEYLTTFGTTLNNALSTHMANSTIHITNTERINWNAKRNINTGGDSSAQDPDTLLDPLFLTSHAKVQSPGKSGEHWYVQQIFYAGTENRTQWASMYVGSTSDFKVRHCYGGVWSAWSPSLQTLQQGGGSVTYGHFVAEPSSTSVGTTRTLTIPEGVKTIYVTAIGAGGGGGGGGNIGPGFIGGGGGSGAIAYRVPVAVTPGESLSIVLGSGGAGGATNGLSQNQGATGGSGGSTSVIRSGTTLVGVSGGNGGFGVQSNTNGSGGLGGTSAIRNGFNLATRPTSNGRNSDDSWKPVAYGTIYRGFGASSTAGGNLVGADANASNNGVIFSFLSSFYSSVFGNSFQYIGAGGNGGTNGNSSGYVGYSGIAFIEWGL